MTGLSVSLSVCPSSLSQWRRKQYEIGGLIAQLHTAEGSGVEVCGADQFARSAENCFTFIFQLPGALVAPSSLGVTGLYNLTTPCF